VGDLLRKKLSDIPSFASSRRKELTGFELQQAVYDKTICERDVVEVVEDFIQQIRVRELTPEQAEIQVEVFIEDNDIEDSVAAFYQLGVEAYRQFIDLYDNHQRTDFHGSLELTRDLLKQGEVEDRHIYPHILVDEMQDLNPVQFGLIKHLANTQDDARVFGVGDDWQSIFGFRGSRPDLFINFGENLGTEDYADTQLESNHRCPDTVVDASNEFIRHNEVRTTKDPTGSSGGDLINVHHLGCDTYSYIANQETVDKIIELIHQTSHDPGETQVLLRQKDGDQVFYHQLKNRLDKTVNATGQGRVDIRTAHDAKGSEAAHVIIPKVLEQGGYPSKKSNKWVKAVKQPPEAYTANDANYQIEEERRLFYVALTRSTDRVDIITIEGAESQFVDELPAEHTTHDRPLPEDDLAQIKSDGKIRRMVTGEINRPPQGSNYATIDWEAGGLISTNLWDATEDQKAKLEELDGKIVNLHNCGIEYRSVDYDDDDVEAEKLQLQVDTDTEVLD